MKHGIYLVGVASLLGLATAAGAQDRAASAELPPAVKTIGIRSDQILSRAEAQRVRGAGGTVPTIHFPLGLGPCRLPYEPPSEPPVAPDGVHQVKEFDVEGVAVGTVTLMEGMIAQFQYVDGDGMVVQGTFGGLEGSVGSVGGKLSFTLQGKAYQETFDFAGQFHQHFQQTYRWGH